MNGDVVTCHQYASAPLRPALPPEILPSGLLTARISYLRTTTGLHDPLEVIDRPGKDQLIGFSAIS
jgi:hypothetical protein